MSKNKYAIIHGATSSNGYSICKKLALSNFNILAISNDETELKQLKKTLESTSKVQIYIKTIDMSEPEKYQTIITEYPDFIKASSALINASEVFQASKAVQSLDFEELAEIIDTNLKCFFYITKVVLPFFLDNENGHILNIGSVYGKWPLSNNAVYNSTKSAIQNAVEGMRLDLIGTNIRVTNIEPGLVDTDELKKRFDSLEAFERTYNNVELLLPEDIADAALWCISQPQSVNIQELVIFPTDQAGVGYLSRRG